MPLQVLIVGILYSPMLSSSQSRLQVTFQQCHLKAVPVCDYLLLSRHHSYGQHNPWPHLSIKQCIVLPFFSQAAPITMRAVCHLRLQEQIGVMVKGLLSSEELLIIEQFNMMPMRLAIWTLLSES